MQVVPTTSTRDGAAVRVPSLKQGKKLAAALCVVIPPLACNSPEAAQALIVSSHPAGPPARIHVLSSPCRPALGARCPSVHNITT